LLVRECSQCKEVHIFGFYHQLSSDQKSIDRERMVVVVTGDCKCGAKVSSEYDVFTSPDGSAARVIAKERQRVNDTQLRFMEREVELRQRATDAEAGRDKLREALAKLTLKWRIDDFNGKNFPTKREAAYEVEAALKEPVKSNELLCPPHKCRCIARIHNMAPGRDWWLGELTEPVPEWPHETHCLHITTPLKSVVFLCNRGDLSGLAVLCDIPFPIVNETWRERMSDAYKRAALKEPTDSNPLEPTNE
jgi:hypothetical protein